MATPFKASVCLVTSGHLATNPRLVKEADALVGAGYHVTVVASRFSGWGADADAEFATRSWDVKTVGFGPFVDLPTRVLDKARGLALKRLARVTPRAMIVADRALHPVSGRLIRAARAVRADMYIAHNLAALPAAARAARAHDAVLGFDAEDFHAGELPDVPEHEPMKELIRTIERHYLPRCAHLTAAAPGIAARYARTYGIKEPAVVLNTFPASFAPAAPTDRGTAKPSPTLYWFSQTIGPNRGLETAVQAVGASRARPTLVLLGTPAPGFASHLQQLARRHASEDRLQLRGPAPPAQMVSIAAEHDAGLASEQPHTINRDICLTNKIFTYTLAGVPTLASETTAQRELAPQLPGAMLLYPPTDAAALAARLDELLLRPEALERARRAAWELGQQRYHWEHDARLFLDSVATALA